LAERISAEIDNDIAEIASVTVLIQRFGKSHGLPEAAVFHMVLAFDELLTNIISHGFLDGGRHKISASLKLDGDRFEGEIVDDGIAFDPLAGPVPDTSLPAEQREAGGLGIHFVRSVMDQLDYRRTDGRNYFKMVKRVPAEPAR
jgi:serine/threonine-protein kinase RsbW